MPFRLERRISALPVCSETFAVEEAVECWFVNRSSAAPRGGRVVGDVARERFRDDGLIVDHRDLWSVVAGREEPYDGW